MFVILCTLLMWFVPGYFTTSAIFPTRDDLRFRERLALSVLFSLLLSTIIAVTLSQFRVFYEAYAWFAIFIVTGLTYFISLRRGANHRMLVKQSFQAVKEPEFIIFVSALILTLGIYTYLVLSNDDGEAMIGWGHYGFSIMTIDQGHFPETTLEYGIQMNVLTNKVASSLLTTMWIMLAGIEDDSQIAMYYVRFLFGLSTFIGAWAFLRKLMTAPFAAATIVTIGWTGLIASKMSSYRSESLGIGIFFISLYASQKAFENNTFRWAIIAGLGLGLTALTHGVPGLMALIWYCSVFGAGLLVEQWHFRKRIPTIMVSAMTTGLLVVGVLGWIGNTDTVKDLELRLVLGEDISETVSQIGDPTLVWFQLVTGETVDFTAQPVEPWTFYISPEAIIENVVIQMQFIEYRSFDRTMEWVLPILVVVGWLLFFLKHPSEQQYIVLALPLAILGTIALALLFSLVYTDYLPAMHPMRREILYIQLFAVIMFWLGVQNVLRILKKHILNDPELNRFLLTLINVSVIAVILSLPDSRVLLMLMVWFVAIVLLFQRRPFAYGKFTQIMVLGIMIILVGTNIFANHKVLFSLYTDPNPAANAESAIQWLEDNTTPEDITTINVRTMGMINTLVQRQVLTDGRDPYLQPENLQHALSMTLDLQLFYSDPTQTYLLDKYDIDFVIVARDRSFGGAPFYDLAANQEFLAIEALELEAQFNNILIFSYKALPK